MHSPNFLQSNMRTKHNSGSVIFVLANLIIIACFIASTWFTFQGIRGGATDLSTFIWGALGGLFVFIAYSLTILHLKQTKSIFDISFWVLILFLLGFFVSFVSNTAYTVKLKATNSFYESELAQKQTLLVQHIGRYKVLEEQLIPETVKKRRDEFNALITNFRIQVLDPGAPGLGGRAREIQNQLLSPRFVGSFTKTRFPSTAECKANMKTCEEAVDTLIENYTKQFENLTIKPLLSEHEGKLAFFAEAKKENQKLLIQLAELQRKRESSSIVQETVVTGGASYIDTPYQQALVNLIKETASAINSQNDRLEILGVNANEPKALFDNAGLGELSFFLSKLYDIIILGVPGYEEVKGQLAFPIVLAVFVDFIPFLIGYVVKRESKKSESKKQRTRLV